MIDAEKLDTFLNAVREGCMPPFIFADWLEEGEDPRCYWVRQAAGYTDPSVLRNRIATMFWPVYREKPRYPRAAVLSERFPRGRGGLWVNARALLRAGVIPWPENLMSAPRSDIIDLFADDGYLYADMLFEGIWLPLYELIAEGLCRPSATVNSVDRVLEGIAVLLAPGARTKLRAKRF